MIKSLKIILIIILYICQTNIHAQDAIFRGGDADEGMGIILVCNIIASSVLGDKKNQYEPIKAIDGEPSTAWAEGVEGSGIGEWIKLYFNDWRVHKHLNKIYKMIIINGLAKNKKLYYENNRVKKLLIEFSEGQKKEVILKDDELGYQTIKFNNIPSKWIKLTIVDVYKGTKYNDTCIAEIHLDHWDDD